MSNRSVKIGFIGCGNMAGAIIRGIVHGGVLELEEIGVYDTSKERMNVLREYNLCTFADAKELVRSTRFIVLSVKPQAMPQVLEAIAPSIREDHVIISIAAGITYQYICETIGFQCSVVPVMPNTPLLIGSGSVAMAHVQPIDDKDFDFVHKIFALSGHIEIVPADKLNEVIPVNGSSPAFVYLFAKTAADYGARYGIDRDAAMRLICHTLIGSAKMLLESGKTADELIEAVCSPGGTTLKGMEALEEFGFCKALNEAADACVKRAYELGQ